MSKTDKKEEKSILACLYLKGKNLEDFQNAYNLFKKRAKELGKEKELKPVLDFFDTVTEISKLKEQ